MVVVSVAENRTCAMLSFSSFSSSELSTMSRMETGIGSTTSVVSLEAGEETATSLVEGVPVVVDMEKERFRGGNVGRLEFARIFRAL